MRKNKKIKKIFKFQSFTKILYSFTILNKTFSTKIYDYDNSAWDAMAYSAHPPALAYANH